MKFKKLSAAILASLAFSGLSHAAKPGAYVGGGLGYSSLENFTDATRKTRGGVGGQVFAGYNFNKNLGLELGYRKYANTTYNIDGFNNFTSDYNMHDIRLVGKAYLPLNDTSPFNLYALLGVAEVYGTGNLKFDSDKLRSDSSNALVATAGVGASYDISSHVTAGIEYSHSNGKSGNDNNIGIPASNLTTLNIAYNFG